MIPTLYCRSYIKHKIHLFRSTLVLNLVRNWFCRKINNSKHAVLRVSVDEREKRWRKRKKILSTSNVQAKEKQTGTHSRMHTCMHAHTLTQSQRNTQTSATISHFYWHRCSTSWKKRWPKCTRIRSPWPKSTHTPMKLPMLNQQWQTTEIARTDATKNYQNQKRHWSREKSDSPDTIDRQTDKPSDSAASWSKRAQQAETALSTN